MIKYPYISDNKCIFCNNDIIIKRKRDTNNKYCSTGCVGKHLRTKIKVKTKCLNCESEFDNRSGDKNIFCSRKCQIEYRVKNKKIYERVCKTCGKKFYPKNITYSRIQNIYCSTECNRIYNFDTNYFRIIDNEEKAYWLGFIYADGNLYKSTFTMKLNKKDKEHIILFKTHIKGEQPIKDVNINKAFIQITSKEIARQLNNLGVMPRKTFKIQMPVLREDLYNDFIRGYFDGDGCIYVTKKYHTFSMYTASNSFKESMKDFFIKNLDIKLSGNKNNLSKGKASDIVKIYHFLYDKPEIVFLDRKKEKFEKFLEYNEE